MKHIKVAASGCMELARKWKKTSAGLSALVAAICLIVASTPTISYAVPMVLNATEDRIILDGNNSNNLWPGLLASELGTSGAGSIWLSILKFDLSSLTGRTINSATLEITSFFNHNSGTFAHEVYSSSVDSWTEDTVTGVNRPSDSTLTLLHSTNISGTSQAYTWNVLAGVVGAHGLAGANKILTLFVRPKLSQVGNVFGPHFNDRDDLSGFPRLLLDVSSVVACVAAGEISRISVNPGTVASSFDIRPSTPGSVSTRFTTTDKEVIATALRAQASHERVQATGNAPGCGAVAGGVSLGGTVVTIIPAP